MSKANKDRPWDRFLSRVLEAGGPEDKVSGEDLKTALRVCSVYPDFLIDTMLPSYVLQRTKSSPYFQTLNGAELVVFKTTRSVVKSTASSLSYYPFTHVLRVRFKPEFLKELEKWKEEQDGE